MATIQSPSLQEYDYLSKQRVYIAADMQNDHPQDCSSHHTQDQNTCLDGVPSFFRWLTAKYPYLLSKCKEDPPIDGEFLKVDITKKNPNEKEYDNLYLDLNGIIHPCCHPDDKDAPETEELMIEAIFKYLDRLVALVRPRKVLYMAIDGVAPRAKMNQQRARRYKTARDSELKKKEKEREHKLMRERGEEIPQERINWDYNVITPGTTFMDKVAKGIRWWIHDRMNNVPGYKGLTIIFSDANMEGEGIVIILMLGEHKIAEFIRLQRAQKGFNPNTKHIIYGLDADLIMLSLMTHEPHFEILRESVFPRGKSYDVEKKEMGAPEWIYKPFQFLHIDILREHLAKEFKMDLDFYDFERIIDDFVFMCFFVGNDFLPHLPSLDIREGAIDKLIGIYKAKLPEMGGYLVKGGDIDFSRVEVILQELAQYEDFIFKQRLQSDSKRRNDQSKRKRETEGRMRDLVIQNPQMLTKLGDDGEKEKKRKIELEKFEENRLASLKLKESLGLASFLEPIVQSDGDSQVFVSETVSLPSEKMESTDILLPTENDSITTDVMSGKTTQEVPIESISTGIQLDEETSESTDTPNNSTIPSNSSLLSSLNDPSEIDRQVQLGENGWKERYYRLKFKIPLTGHYTEQHENIFKSYMEGLSWVMKYYYEGVPSWSWFYDYHYAPFSSDLLNISKFKVEFQKGTPFAPFTQLLAVFPANSSHALPKEYAKMMTDKNSPISDFYPDDFEVDLNGKVFEHQGVVLLPFIDEKRLIDQVSVLEKTLSVDEKRRNKRDENQIYVYYDGRSYIANSIAEVMMGGSNEPQFLAESHGTSGYIVAYEGACEPSGKFLPPFESDTMKPVLNNLVLGAVYRLPPYTLHHCRLLDGCKVEDGLVEKIREIERVTLETHVRERLANFEKEKREKLEKSQSYTVDTSRQNSHVAPRQEYSRNNSDSRGNRPPERYQEPPRYQQSRNSDSRGYPSDRRDNRFDSRDSRGSDRSGSYGDRRSDSRSDSRYEPRPDNRRDPRDDRGRPSDDMQHRYSDHSSSRGDPRSHDRRDSGRDYPKDYSRSDPRRESHRDRRTDPQQLNPYILQNFQAVAEIVEEVPLPPPPSLQEFFDSSNNFSLLEDHPDKIEE